ncbi:hypothetical protein BU14_0588s0001 [Porphyra umbilicalis]|uniref:Uncharacterized protein n=1 Tax=Porphyra umbilicalis TaxID=2786 RepID=A0A1X6NRM0_PORUM|nr:hypothetical protein BU14_0588s0001 [Porphyra umbilicalis]|eukprot:OSX71136.1 hypothetical protein BU14_0588s0001 [Porphyra umbilicalis]
MGSLYVGVHPPGNPRQSAKSSVSATHSPRADGGRTMQQLERRPERLQTQPPAALHPLAGGTEACRPPARPPARPRSTRSRLIVRWRRRHRRHHCGSGSAAAAAAPPLQHLPPPLYLPPTADDRGRPAGRHRHRCWQQRRPLSMPDARRHQATTGDSRLDANPLTPPPPPARAPPRGGPRGIRQHARVRVASAPTQRRRGTTAATQATRAAPTHLRHSALEPGCAANRRPPFHCSRDRRPRCPRRGLLRVASPLHPPPPSWRSPPPPPPHRPTTTASPPAPSPPPSSSPPTSRASAFTRGRGPPPPPPHGVPPPPTAATLARLQGAHVTAIPFENLTVWGTPRMATTLEAAWAKLVATPRGGWCLEHNALVVAVARALGFAAATPRVGWVLRDGSGAGLAATFGLPPGSGGNSGRRGTCSSRSASPTGGRISSTRGMGGRWRGRCCCGAGGGWGGGEEVDVRPGDEGVGVPVRMPDGVWWRVAPLADVAGGTPLPALPGPVRNYTVVQWAPPATERRETAGGAPDAAGAAGARGASGHGAAGATAIPAPHPPPTPSIGTPSTSLTRRARCRPWRRPPPLSSTCKLTPAARFGSDASSPASPTAGGRWRCSRTAPWRA